MTTDDCLFEQVANMGVGISLLFIAMGVSVIAVIVLPALGLVSSAAVFILAAYFFTAPRSKACTLH